jgi:hypothetical protein
LLLSVLKYVEVEQESAVRSILIGIFVLSAWIVVLPAAHAQGGTQNQGHPLSAPVGHRQPTQAEVGNDEASEEDRVTKEIDEENRILDQELKGICRGC